MPDFDVIPCATPDCPPLNTAEVSGSWCTFEQQQLPGLAQVAAMPEPEWPAWIGRPYIGYAKQALVVEQQVGHDGARSNPPRVILRVMTTDGTPIGVIDDRATEENGDAFSRLWVSADASRVQLAEAERALDAELRQGARLYDVVLALADSRSRSEVAERARSLIASMPKPTRDAYLANVQTVRAEDAERAEPPL